MGHAIPEHIYRILDLARWAPSGDNTQPWRFEILDNEHILVHGFDTRDHIVYDLDGHASQLAVGALLETLLIAASGVGRQARISRRPDTPETHLLFDVQFEKVAHASPDSLLPYIETRVVQRRPMSIKPLTGPQKQALADALPPSYRVVWFEGFAKRWHLARFMFDNAKIRLTIPEGFAVHSTIIEWGAQFSEDRIPDQAVGVDPLTARLMRWVMGSDWARVEFFNKYLLGDLPPRIQLDLLPGVACAAHFALLTPTALQTVDDYLAAGRAMQRFWLTAASLGLFIQPEMTPVIFTRYHRQQRIFTQMGRTAGLARNLNAQLADFLPGENLGALFFIGRLGTGPGPQARSTRKPVASLLQHS